MAYTGTDYEKSFKVYLVIWVLMVGAVIYVAVKPDVPPPPNAKAIGCYVSALAAPIRLDTGGMQVIQPDLPKFGFHLERHKTGIALTAERPLAAKPVGNGYAYYFYSPGVGTFLNFYRVSGQYRYGEFNEDNLSRFVMIANDGAELVYEKASSGESCKTASEVG